MRFRAYAGITVAVVVAGLLTSVESGPAAAPLPGLYVRATGLSGTYSIYIGQGATGPGVAESEDASGTQ